MRAVRNSAFSTPGAPKMPMPSKALIAAAQQLVIAMAHVQTVRPIVQGFQQEVLHENTFLYASHDWVEEALRGTRVTNIKDTYEMQQEDFARYDRLVYAKSTAYGFQITEGQCALLVAEHEQTKAEWALLETSKPFLNSLPGVSVDPMKIYNLENRKKLLDLLLGMLTKFFKK